MKLKLRTFLAPYNAKNLLSEDFQRAMEMLRASKSCFNNAKGAERGYLSTPPLFTPIKDPNDRQVHANKLYTKSIERLEDATELLALSFNSESEEIDCDLSVFASDDMGEIYSELTTVLDSLGKAIQAQKTGFLITPPGVRKAKDEETKDRYIESTLKSGIVKLNDIQADMRSVLISNGFSNKM